MKKAEMLENIPFPVYNSKIVGNNTVYYEDESGNSYIRLYKVDVVIKYANKNEVLISSGGYKSKTTKDRINSWFSEFTNSKFQIVQKNKIWYLTNGDRKITFFDGMHIKFTSDGELEFLNRPPREVDTERIKKLNEKIDEYSKEFIEKFMNDKIPAPSTADCWFCALFPNSSGEHIASHLEEKYFVPSMLYNSIFNNPQTIVSPIAKSFVKKKWGISLDKPYASYIPKDIVQDQLEKNLNKYIRRKLGLPV